MVTVPKYVVLQGRTVVNLRANLHILNAVFSGVASFVWQPERVTTMAVPNKKDKLKKKTHTFIAFHFVWFNLNHFERIKSGFFI